MQGKQQDESKVTFAPKIKTNDCKIDWSKSANEIHNLIRAFSPSQGAFTSFNNKRLKIFSSLILDNSSDSSKCGEIVICSKKLLAVQTGNGILDIHEVQSEGKKRMKVEEFLRGTKLQIKMMFGD